MFSRFIRIKHREFLFLYIAIHRNFRNWHQIFYNRSGLYKIHALPIFIFLVYRFHGNIDYLKKHIQQNFNLFPKTGLISTSNRVREGYVGKTPIENARYVPEKLYRTTLTDQAKKIQGSSHCRQSNVYECNLQVVCYFINFQLADTQFPLVV